VLAAVPEGRLAELEAILPAIPVFYGGADVDEDGLLRGLPAAEGYTAVGSPPPLSGHATVRRTARVAR